MTDMCTLCAELTEAVRRLRALPMDANAWFERDRAAEAICAVPTETYDVAAMKASVALEIAGFGGDAGPDLLDQIDEPAAVAIILGLLADLRQAAVVE